MPPSRTSRQAPLGLAFVLYSLIAAGALLWNFLIDLRWYAIFVTTGMASPLQIGLSVLWGSLFALGTIWASRWSVHRFDWAQDLYRWFASILGEIRWRDAAALAIFSSIAEEMIFRGVMLPAWGLWISSVCFGLAHLPPKIRLLPWTVFATVIGVVFGAITLWSGTIAGAMVGHFLINLVNLKAVSEFSAPNSPPPGQNLPPLPNPP